MSAITMRRSIRRFKAEDVSCELIADIIEAGRLAPSAKNRQPWRFIVTCGASKLQALEAMQTGILRERTEPLLPNCSDYISGAEYTLKIMQQAPVVIFVMNTLGQSLYDVLSPEDRIAEICNVQSIGAAIENMSLRAVELGLGSLWIGDIYFAYEELKNYLNSDGIITAALAIGYADECPKARPRQKLTDIVEWRS